MIFTFTTSQFFLVLGFAIIIAVVASAAAMMPSRDYFKETRKRLDEAEESIRNLSAHLFRFTEVFNDIANVALKVMNGITVIDKQLNCIQRVLENSSDKTQKKHGKKRKAHCRRQ